MPAVSLNLVKQHLYIEHDRDDELLEHYIETAESWIVDYIGKPFPDPVPATLKQAILQLVGHFYENREATLIGVSVGYMPFSVVDLISPHREWEM